LHHPFYTVKLLLGNLLRSMLDGTSKFPTKLVNNPFGWADKPAEKHCWLICCERKILFRLKKTS
jgi:hypothetical protein